MNLEQTTVLGNYIVIIIGMILTFILLNKWINNQIDRTTNETVAIHLSTQIRLSDINGILDDIIQDSISEFLLENNISSDMYITTELEDELRRFLALDVSNKISKPIYTKLTYVLRDTYIYDYIAKRIMNTVTLFVARQNTK